MPETSKPEADPDNPQEEIEKMLPTLRFVVFGVPVVLTPSFVLNIGGEVNVKFEPLDFSFTSGFNAKALMLYDGEWHNSVTHNYIQDAHIPALKMNDKTNGNIKVFIEPGLQFKLYGILSPYFNISGYGQLDAAYAKNPAWTFYVGAELEGGVKAKILSKTLFDFNVNFFKLKIPILYGENKLSVSSGNNQLGISGRKLPQPLVAKVTNTFGYPLSGYKVLFENTQGNGKLSRTEAATNNDGEAAVELTLNKDKNIISHTIEASAIEKNETPHKGKPLKDSPILFSASVWDEEIDGTVWKFDLKSDKGRSATTVLCKLKENSVAEIGSHIGTYMLIINSLTVDWVADTVKPPGCTIQLKGTINGTACSGTYTHWDYDEKGTKFVWDSGTFTGYLSSASDS